MLYNCRNVNQKGIDFFMNEMNPLAEITFVRCGYVDILRLKEMAKEKNWNQVQVRQYH
jgi:hypothetical protein